MNPLNMNKMKRLCIAFLLWCCLLPIAADNYTALWKQWEAAKDKDLPRTEINILEQIVQKATADKAYGHLLKAQLRRVVVRTSLSRDSLYPELQHLEKLAAAEKNEVMRAVRYTTLARYYQELRQTDTTYNTPWRTCCAKALHAPQLLARTPAKGWEPLVEKGIDSRIFNDDLLHIIGIENKAFAFLHTFYEQQGNRRAACLAAAMELTANRETGSTAKKWEKSKYLQRIDSLINVYQDLQEAGELAIAHAQFMREATHTQDGQLYNYINYALSKWGTWPRMNCLRNMMSDITQPVFDISIGDCQLLTGKSRTIRVNMLRHIDQLTFNIYKLSKAENRQEQDIEEGLASLMRYAERTPIQTFQLKFFGTAPYKTVSDTAVIQPLEKGTYLIEATTDNRTVKPQYQLLHVSDLMTLWEGQTDGSTRFVVVDAHSGMPVKGASIKLWNQHNAKTTPFLLTTDEKGEGICKQPKKYSQLLVTTADDRHAPIIPFFSNTVYGYETNKDQQSMQLFTDRRLYRPGQTVRVAVIAYNRTQAVETKALKGHKVKLVLRNPRFQILQEKEAVTDEFGTATADFTLPAHTLTGYFTIGAGNKQVAFQVEEYKRPTFYVAFDEVKTAYERGDTVTLTGRAMTYAGMPVQTGKVRYTVQRKPTSWWRMSQLYDGNRILVSGELQTDAQGVFKIRVPMELPDNVHEKGIRGFYHIETHATVTDGNGESHEGTSSLPIGTHASALTSNLPEKIRTDQLSPLVFTLYNHAGTPLDSVVSYTIDSRSYQAHTNSEANLTQALQGLANGRHRLTAICGNDTLKQDFVLFSLNDKHCVVPTHDWFYVSHTAFPNDGSPVYLQLGAADSTLHVVYSITHGKTLLEQGTLDLQGQLHLRQFAYNPVYGDGLTLNFAWVKDGRCYTHHATITRPLPDKKLKTTWTTFRNRLTPGQQEEWVLQVKHPDGRPAHAQLMVSLYDKALDALSMHQWRFNVRYRPMVPFRSWLCETGNAAGLYGYSQTTPLMEKALDFYHFSEACFLPIRYGFQKEHFLAAAAPLMSRKAVAKNDMAQVETAVESTAWIRGTNGSTAGEEPEDAIAQVRENLQETAFFYPQLTTDEQGFVHIRFTLPESVTTWKLLGLTHDQDMNFRLLQEEVTAQKMLMVQPNMPRFVRQGDKTELKARVSNMSGQTIKATARMELKDATTMQTLTVVERQLTVEGNQSPTVSFPFTAPNASSLLVCRVTLNAEGCSDGEQHYLPVLPATETIVNTLPFTFHEAGTTHINLKQLMPAEGKDMQLTLEYTNNPAWLAIQALPALSVPQYDNAISLACAYYANRLSRTLLQQTPIIKQTLQQWQQEQGTDSKTLGSALAQNQELKTLLLEETPWTLESEKETERKQQLIRYFDDNTLQASQALLLQRLAKLQQQDGSFSWCEGMPGNLYMTLSVAETLARLAQTTTAESLAEAMLQRANGYLKKWASNYIKDLKKEQKGNHVVMPNESACHFLYIQALMKQPATPDTEWLLALLEKQTKKYSIYGKAQTALILAHYGRNAKAMEDLQSVKEHTVYTEEQGRYFDTQKAAYSWMDYRIPTQTAVIEALGLLTPDDKKTLQEMQRWLLMQKRTQAWTTPIHTVNAVHAFLYNNMACLQQAPTTPLQVSIDGNRLAQKKGTTALGYVKMHISGQGQMKDMSLTKRDAGTSWGAVYVCAQVPSAMAGHTEAGLSVKREIVGASKALHIGDRVTVRTTIHADRDFDFVQLTDKRAACLEPVMQLSGYHNGYYCTPRDNATHYFFHKLTKGKHVIETAYFIDREGNFLSGSCTVQCAYSPEYAGRDSGKPVTVTDNK